MARKKPALSRINVDTPGEASTPRTSSSSLPPRTKRSAAKILSAEGCDSSRLPAESNLLALADTASPVTAGNFDHSPAGAMLLRAYLKAKDRDRDANSCNRGNGVYWLPCDVHHRRRNNSSGRAHVFTQELRPAVLGL
jgi:hypothetical protein